MQRIKSIIDIFIDVILSLSSAAPDSIERNRSGHIHQTDNTAQHCFQHISCLKHIEHKHKQNNTKSILCPENAHPDNSCDQDQYSLRDKTCMVIGNGEMGKVAAQALQEAGADVTVTIRQYRSGVVNIPLGCKRINYGDRMEYMPQCDLVVSATASPNFTLKEELFQGIRTKDDLILIDLAVPRDIEPSVGKIQGVTLYDMDSFRIEEVPAELQENLEAAGAIVREQMDEFFQWLDGRDLIPRIQDIKDEAVNDLNLRIAKILKKTPMEEDDRQNLVHAVDTAAGKVVNKLIFGLRDSLNQEIFLECVAGLEKIYEE